MCAWIYFNEPKYSQLNKIIIGIHLLPKEIGGGIYSCVITKDVRSRGKARWYLFSNTKNQEKRISSAKAKASTVATKAETLRSKLTDVMKSAAIPEAAHHHKKSKVMLGVLTNSPLTHTLPLSPKWKSMSAKKRASMQSPLRSSYNKEDELS